MSAGRERVDRHSRVREAGSEVVGEPVKSGLGGGVVGADDPASERGHRGDEQDATKTPLLHARQRALGEQERGSEVDGERLVEVLGGDFIPAERPSEPGV
jgi:hypothetical protein